MKLATSQEVVAADVESDPRFGVCGVENQSQNFGRGPIKKAFIRSVYNIADVHHVVETIINAFSLLLNIFLLYLIKRYSTFGVKIYKYMLTIDALLDLWLSVFTFFAQPFVLTGDGYSVLTTNGFFAGRSQLLDSVLLTLYCFTLHTNIVWIPVQFVYRYRLLCKNNSNATKANILIGTVTVLYSIIALFVIYSLCEVRQEFQPEAMHVLELNNWPKPKNGLRPLFVGSYITHWRMISWLALWITTCSVSIFIVIWCERKIIKHFKRHGNPTHAKTQRMHKEFHRALLAMAICPLITTTAPVLYFCATIAFQLCPGKFSALMTIAVSSITFFNPLTTILFFRCYRRVVIRIFPCGKRVRFGETAAITQRTSNAVPDNVLSQQSVQNK
ncbi:serpentine type 7TM GPCR chemoreceptor str domain-containing protein [Ditylenchus destructor]|uniref:Serpentine type 7TM GPCR chemoreceptor str domain-containing protein n=1 Tax=Ditylenchus destructor TaxID=166010 RepID=A0AAD4N395_9BILA|nr:serpentine type 7TM GPCR chemoreceptor str domain-containing protein [Ditylenchus destructor]